MRNSQRFVAITHFEELAAPFSQDVRDRGVTVRVGINHQDFHGSLPSGFLRAGTNRKALTPFPEKGLHAMMTRVGKLASI
jgi:hypothetical protein